MSFFSFFKKSPLHLPPLKLHNTLSGELEVFTPLSAREVKMYNCGPTPYDQQHIGNLFPPVVANVLRRTLEAWGYSVKQVTNITDFGHLTSDADEGEDKMSKGLAREGLTPSLANMRTLAEKYAAIFFDDVASLNINLKKIIFPRASDYIQEQIALIQALEQKSYAYTLSDGVYFDTAKFTSYGKLGGVNLAGQQEGARVGKNKEKRGSYDFALWKISDGLGWDSPWGKGFPGWHIECTAMIFTLLGKQIDIHTGGIEHIPIHHNNEIAQAESATGKQFVRYWLHNAHITVEGKKISKSLGNTVFLHNIIDKGYSPLSLRYWFLTGHYRTPMNFTWETIEGANTALMRLYKFFFEDLASVQPVSPPTEHAFRKDFYAALAHDLDTPKALARVWELVKDQNTSPAVKKSLLLDADAILGLGLSEKRSTMKISVTEHSDLPQNIQELLLKRELARKDKDFRVADSYRTQIEALGYTLQDTPEGSQVSKTQ